MSVQVQFLDQCRSHPDKGAAFAVSLLGSDTFGSMRKKVATARNYDESWFEFHVSPSDEATHAEAFMMADDVKPLFFFFFFFFSLNASSERRWPR